MTTGKYVDGDGVSQPITPADLALVLLHESGDVVKGKTILQKFAYFVSVEGDIELGFSPHFYGPFSRELERDMKVLSLSGLVEEQISLIGTNRKGWTIRNIRYSLTPEGQERARAVVERYPEVAKDARRLATRLKDRAGVSPRAISLAAKVDFIARTTGVALEADQIASLANDLGWDVEASEVESTVGLLGDLGSRGVGQP